MGHVNATGLQLFAPEIGRARLIPLMLEPVWAGFPSPAADHIEQRLNLNDLCIKHAAATYFLKVEGDSMQPTLFPGDIVVVDRALNPKAGDIVIAVINGEFTVKRLERWAGRVRLVADNPNFAPVEFLPEAELIVNGVVTHIVRAC